MNDTIYMKIALELAENAKGYTSPNPMVGAVIVKEHRIVGEGFHECFGECHAEINALKQAGSASKDATLYVTLEPCNHTGKTPPCTEAILKAGIKRVVTAMEDPNPKVSGGGNDFLRKHGIEVQCGVMRDYAIKLNEAWLKFVQTGIPFVTAKCASTLDGQTATATLDSKWITGVKSRTLAHRLRSEVDAILVGVNTVKADNPSLTCRLTATKRRNPIRIVLDSRLTIPESSHIIQSAEETTTVIATGPDADPSKVERLEKRGVRFLNMPLKEHRIDMTKLMHLLSAMDITHLLIEGGSTVLASAFRENIVDRIFFFFAPKIIGGNDGIPILSGEGASYIHQSILLKDIKVCQFDDDVLIEGSIARSPIV